MWSCHSHQPDGHVTSSPQWQDWQWQGCHKTGQSQQGGAYRCPQVRRPEAVCHLFLYFRSTVDVLSFRFDKDNTQQDKKLDDMDLDDILNRAEDHETITGGDGGASLGGESFLASVAFDVKTEISWEDIIPVEERQKAELEEDQRKAEELAALDTKDRKRSHAPVSYEGMDVDQPVSASTSKKPKGPAPTRKSASQKAMELKERDVRVLIRSMQKWGDIRQRYDIIVCGTKL